MRSSQTLPIVVAGDGLDAGADEVTVCVTTGCAQAASGFDRVDGKIVLIDYATILDRDATLASGGASVVRRARWRETLGRIVDGKNRVAPRFAVSMVTVLERSAIERPVILVIGGGGIGSGSDGLCAPPHVGVVAFDIHASDAAPSSPMAM